MDKTFNIAERFNTELNHQFLDEGFSIQIVWYLAVDLDLDGYDELVVGGHNSFEDNPQRGVIFRADANAQISVADDLIKQSDFPATVWPREIITDDFNGDGRPDVFISAHGWDFDPVPGEPNELLLSNKKGKLVPKKVPFIEKEFSHSAASGDIDGDGDKDIYVGNVAANNVKPYLLLNDGKGNFTLDRSRLPDSLTKPEADWYDTVAFADVDADGHDDLVVGKFGRWQGDNTGYRSKIFYNDGKGRFDDGDRIQLPDPKPLKNNAIGYDITPFDIEGDGDSDLLMVYTDMNHSGWAVQALINDGTGKFSDQTNAHFIKAETADISVDYFMSFLRLFDMNSDGFMDLVPEYVGRNVSHDAPLFWLNDGTGHFSAILGSEFFQYPPELIAVNTPTGVQFIAPFETDSQTSTEIQNFPVPVVGDPVSTGPGGINPAGLGAAGFNELYYLNYARGAAKSVKDGKFETGLDHYLNVGAAKGFKGVADGVTIQVAKDDGPITLVNGNIDARGSSGVDQINGRSGENTISGGKGHDRLEGGNDADALNGGRGSDVLVGGRGADLLRGGKGKDTASYDDADRPVTVNLAAPDSNTRDAKGDIYASIENVAGSSGADRLTGNDKANVLDGGHGNDRLDGGKHKDKLLGGDGKDVLTGGGGRDLFIFKSVDHSTPAKKGRDVITDFNTSQDDRINLKAIDARDDRDGNQAFRFIGDTDFSGTSGELRFEKSAGLTLVHADVDGDALADFSLRLDGSIDLQSGDFLL